MSERIHIEKWEIIPAGRVALHYSNGDTVYVHKSDFDRAFGTIISADYDAVVRDFAIPNP